MTHEEYLIDVVHRGYADILIQSKDDFVWLDIFISHAGLVWRADHINRVQFDWPTVSAMLQPEGLFVPGSVGGWDHGVRFHGALRLKWRPLEVGNCYDHAIEWISTTSREVWCENWNHATVDEVKPCIQKYLSVALPKAEARVSFLRTVQAALD